MTRAILNNIVRGNILNDCLPPTTLLPPFFLSISSNPTPFSHYPYSFLSAMDVDNTTSVKKIGGYGLHAKTHLMLESPSSFAPLPRIAGTFSSCSSSLACAPLDSRIFYQQRQPLVLP